MEKKIIGYKLIKEYPGQAEKIGYVMKITPQQERYYNNKDWPEFWEPIYEEIGVDITSILNKKSSGYYFTNEAFIKSTEAMKEACKQTMELTLKYVDGDTCSRKLLKEKILNQIK